MSSKLILTLFTHSECMLCKIAKASISEVSKKYKFELEEVNIKAKENKKWFEEYKYDVPVLLANDKFLLWHQINPQNLSSKLDQFLDSEKKQQ
ncbi:hypothetical protein BB560_002620 [Smittium megazygosporum]|uniref:Glutaredoxin-like protein n=2 Tax=Smittium megazygosporum TaxID=133381 RepID=A0A2T9ZEA6_9FUNG|nr:hypothetical protein BB560_002620 [Smittium megazygosporum]